MIPKVMSKHLAGQCSPSALMAPTLREGKTEGEIERWIQPSGTEAAGIEVNHTKPTQMSVGRESLRAREWLLYEGQWWETEESKNHYTRHQNHYYIHVVCRKTLKGCLTRGS